MAWLGTWAKRKKITVDNTNVDSDLTQFPVPIVLGTSVGQSAQDLSEIFDDLGANYLKIAITKVDGDTEIYGDIEDWDSGTEDAVIHVAKSDLDITTAAVTELYIYFDPAQADNTTYISLSGGTPAQSVWDSDFEAVYHMSQDPSGSAPQMLDSTSNNDDGTSQGGMTSGNLVDGLIGKAILHDGSVDNIDCNDNLKSRISTIYTLEAVAKFDSTSRNGVVVGYRSTSNSTPILFQLDQNNSDVRLLVRDDAGNIAIATKSAVLDTTNFFYIVGIRNGSDVDINVDSSAGTGDTDTFGAITVSSFRIGAITPGVATVSALMDGLIAEVRVSSIVRSAAWLKATNYALTDDLLTYGATENYGATPEPTQPIITIQT